MIMFCLHPSHRDVHGPETIDSGDALMIIEDLERDGLTVQTATFGTPTGRTVTIFWTQDSDGGVGTVFEHTYASLVFSVPPTDISVRSVISQMTDAVGGHSMHTTPDPAYAVGE